MCEGEKNFKQFMVQIILDYLRKKGAKTVAQKQLHSSKFLVRNEVELKEVFCRNYCTLNWRCQTLHPF
jgi:hypothetical protein